MSDDVGEFVISSVDGIDGIVSIWVCVPAEYAQSGGVACTVQSTLKNVIIENGMLAYQHFETQAGPMTCPACIGTGVVEETTCEYCGGTPTIQDPRYTLKGACSADIATIYVSAVNSQDDLAYTNDVISNLSANTFGSCDTLNGMYEISFMPQRSGTFVVWGVSTSSDYLAVDNISITEGYVECLSADTLITMADGSKRRIDSLRVGELVMDEDGNPTPVYSVSRGRFSPYYTIYTFEDGTTVHEVKRHRFYNADQGFFQYIDNWEIGEHAVKQNGEKVALVSAERVYERTERFGLWTKKGSYFANEILSGMAFCNKRLLANATAEQAVNMMMSIAEHQLLKLIGLEGVLP
jgi:hypothetical protein